jgi:hypothetical protein
MEFHRFIRQAGIKGVDILSNAPLGLVACGDEMW